MCVYEELFHKLPKKYHIPALLSLQKCTQNSLTVERESLSTYCILDLMTGLLHCFNSNPYSDCENYGVMLFYVFHQLGAYRSIVFLVINKSSCSDFFPMSIT